MKMTQGEKITEIKTDVTHISAAIQELKEMLKAHNDRESLYLTKSEAKKEYAGIWTEIWVKSVAFVTAAFVLIEVIQKVRG